MPPIKAGYATVDLPDAGNSLVERGAAIVRAMTAGQLSPDAGNTLLGALAAQARLVETQELMDRIAALESLLRQRNEP